MTEVQFIPQSISINYTAISTSTTEKRNGYASVSARAALLSVSVSPSAEKYTSPIKTMLAQYGGGGMPSPPAEETSSGSFFSDAFHSDLLQGHSDIHIRNGIIKAAAASAAHKADSEAAFFVADLGQVYRQHLRWKKHLPDVVPFYAVKANPDPNVLRLLAALGSGFDCASQNEINMVLRMGGVDPQRIIFANPCKATSFVRHAARSGVDMMTFDNTDELYKIARAHPGAKLVVRILTDDSKSLCRLGLKFGAPLVTVPGLLAKARELGLDVIGVSFHVGSGCFDSSAFADAVMRARTAFDMGRDAGYAFTLLDVGGGFEDGRFEETAGVLRGALDTYFGDRASQGIQVIAEPGRYYVSKAFTLVTNIIARRARANSDLGGGMPSVGSAGAEGPSVMYYINDGVYGSFNCIMFDHQTPIPYCLTVGKVLVDTEEGQEAVERGPKLASSVWGPTCDSIDCVCPMVDLPAHLEVGDWLGFRNMGAYTVCAASQFNGFETSPVVYTAGEEVVVGELMGAW